MHNGLEKAPEQAREWVIQFQTPSGHCSPMRVSLPGGEMIEKHTVEAHAAQCIQKVPEQYASVLDIYPAEDWR